MSIWSGKKTIIDLLKDIDVSTLQVLVDLGIIDTNILNLIDYIGAKTDFLPLPFNNLTATIIGYLQTAYYHVHGESFTYPRLDDPIPLTAPAGVWAVPANTTEILPAIFTDRPFDLHYGIITAISGNCDGIITFYAGEVGFEERIDDLEFHRNNNFTGEQDHPMIIPPQPAGTRISARAHSNAVGDITVGVKVKGHYYG